MRNVKRILGALLILIFSFQPTLASEQCITPENGDTPAIQPADWVEGQGGSISNLCELRWLSVSPAAWDSTWMQTANIDASVTKYWNGGAGFLPIDSFSGRYDGNNYHVSNLTINRPHESAIGLFSYVNETAVLQNIQLRNVDIYGNTHAGALAGYSYGRIENIYVSGAVSGNGWTGGVIGTAAGKGRNIQGEQLIVTSSGSYSGGLLGVLLRQDSHYENLSSSGEIKCTRSDVGGLVGSSQGVVSDSFSSMKGFNHSFGGLIGDNSEGTLLQSFFDCEIGGQEGDESDCWDGISGDDTFGRETAQLKTPQTFIDAQWEVGTAWQQGSWVLRQDKYPTLQHPNSPIFIRPSAAELTHSLKEDREFTLEVEAFSPSNEAVSYQLLNAPSWLSIDDRGVISGLPSHLGIGSFRDIAVKAVSGNYSNQLPTISIDVAPVNDVPTVSSGHIGVIIGGSSHIDLMTLVSDEVGESQDYLFELSSAQLGEVALNGSVVTYRHGGTDIGIDRFAFTVIDGEHRVTGSISIDIMASPTLVNGAANLNEDQTLTFELSNLAVGINNPAFRIDVPSHGEAQLSGTILTYTPNPHFYGSDNIGIVETNTGLDSALVLTIHPVSDPLLANTTTVSLLEDTSEEIDLSHLVTDVDNQPLVFSLATLPTKGQLTLEGDIATYTPNRDANGEDTFDYVVTDGVRPSVKATVTLDIVPVNDPPKVRDEVYSTYEEKIIYLDELVSDVDGPLQASQVDVSVHPKLGVIEQVEYTTQWRYVPGGTLGEDNVTFTITDGEFSADVVVTIHATTAPKEPFYDEQGRGVIANLANLRWVSEVANVEDESKSWILSADIEAGETRFWNFVDIDETSMTENQAKGFQPISIDIDNFFGTNFAIQNLYLYAPRNRAIGLFGDIALENIQDLTLSNVDLTGGEYSGLLVGNLKSGENSRSTSISNVRLQGKMSSRSNSGGLVGLSWRNLLVDKVEVTLDSRFPKEMQTGGMIGTLYADLVMTESSATVTGRPIMGGIVGIVGYSHTSVEILNSFAVTPSTQYGLVEGNLSGLEIVNSFYNCDTSFISNCDVDLGGRTTEQLKTPNTFTGEDWRWDALSPWKQGGWLLQKGEYPRLRWDDVPLFAEPTNALINEQVTEDETYQRQFAATPLVNGSSVAYRLTSNVPAWLSLDENGLLSGTPTNDDVGTVKDVVIEVVEGERVNRMLPFDIVVNNVNDAPTIAGTPSTTVKQDVSYQFAPVANDIDAGDKLFFFISNQPRWMHFNSQTGLLEGTPRNADVGVYPDIAIAVSDGEYFVALPPFTITVENVNDAPVISGFPATTVKQDIPYHFAPIASDIDEGDRLSFSITNKPSWAVFNLATGALSGTPTNDDVGVTSGIVIAVSDGLENIALPAFSITVENVNDTPVISGTPATRVQQDAMYRFVPIASDIDVVDTLSFSISQLPSWATFDLKTGALSGTPTNEDVGVTEGIVISVSDGIETVALPMFSITVENVNDAPVISGSPATRVSQDVAYQFVPLANDIDVNDVLAFTIANKPAWAHFDVTTGILSGTPSNDHVGVTEGIEISVSDGIASAKLPAFSITIDNVNDVPTISGSPRTTVDQDVAYRFTPVADDIDVEDTLTFSITNKPLWAQFDVATGGLYGLPTEEDVGVTEGIIISVSDGKASASLAPFSITVVDINNGPTAVNDTFELAAPTSNERYVLNVLHNDSHVDDLAFSLVSASTKQGKVQVVGDTLELTLDAAHSDVSLTYFVEDIEGLTSQASVQLTIERNTDIVFGSVNEIILDATGALTKVNLTTPLAQDRTGAAVPVELVGGKTHFAPGRHELVWQAEKGDGTKATATQILRVNPMVSLPSSVRVSQDTQTYDVAVLLNGDLPFDQLEVPYSLDGVEQAPLVIQQGTYGYIALTSLLAGEQYEIVLDSTLNLGENSTFTLTVADTYVLPKVSALLSQKGEERSWICQQQGNVEIELVVENATDSEVFSIQPKDDAWVRLSDDAHSARFVVSTTDLAVGSTYAAFTVANETALADGENIGVTHVSYFDVAEKLAMLSNTLDSDGDGIPDALEGYKDSDGDGIPDYLDAVDDLNVQPSSNDDQDSFLAETESGVALATGASKYSEDGLLVDVSRMPIAAGNWYHSGMFDFIIKDIPEPGALVSVVLPQQQSLAKDVTYRKLIGEQWLDFAADGADSGYPNGALHSSKGEYGVCPPPQNPEKMVGNQSDVWTPGLTEGHWCIQVSLRDGGLNDADGLVNGMIVDPSGAMSIYAAPTALNDTISIVIGEEAVIRALDNDEEASEGMELEIVHVDADEGVAWHNGSTIYFTPPENRVGEFHIRYTVRNQWNVMHSAEVTVTVSEDTSGTVEDAGGGTINLWMLWLMVCLWGARRYRARPIRH
ncbi:Ig-like domain-containing protein [Enterovibrio sp. ZSDZ35]|uniref:Ig-like domain-containing protein n=1 Tax=Enterovibrio qingdaonensis TaxID=2899818 RepID=A0ABT5QFZ3_9GAMM|nr:Ig-like domain-containing protein [Enterovibrio sp. ZSDZ35]MDD1779901.1 Ig-like domain-containing protein [Enterovibrio sp. ZSDZ35]